MGNFSPELNKWIDQPIVSQKIDEGNYSWLYSQIPAFLANFEKSKFFFDLTYLIDKSSFVLMVVDRAAVPINSRNYQDVISLATRKLTMDGIPLRLFSIPVSKVFPSGHDQLNTYPRTKIRTLFTMAALSYLPGGSGFRERLKEIIQSCDVIW